MNNLEQPKEIEDVSDEPVEAPKELEREPSKFKLFLRRLLRWGTGVFAIFALGIILTWIVRVNPRIKEIRELETQLEAANQQVSDLEKEVSALKDVDDENAVLQADLKESQLHLSILGILVDMSSAQLALTNNSPETAQAALSETGAKLSSLASKLGSVHLDTISAMQERLSLALDEITDDVFAAQSDLEVLRNNILVLERTLFGK